MTHSQFLCPDFFVSLYSDLFLPLDCSAPVCEFTKPFRFPSKRSKEQVLISLAELFQFCPL